ncbi:SUMF1/EgtB/PvdO family nonheme iron enzyme [Vampirovibrio sp.]|uniref:SUMF1/EgtB/PvdO family nonheme iron enzyme n=1 Tax=Vampirovibrio sp. TaxID=2717857 RepID=UPI003592F87C
MGQAIILEKSSVLADSLKSAFLQTFARTERIFNLIAPAAYGMRPIPLRHPINFYEGHLAAFIWNTLFVRVLEQGPCHPVFDVLFERGIDPESQTEADQSTISAWPDRAAVQAYRANIHQQLFDYLDTVDFETAAHPLLHNGAVFFLLLEHELMHQETLLYMIHQLPPALKQKPDDMPLFRLDGYGSTPDVDLSQMVEIPSGLAILGASHGMADYAWDNEMPRATVEVGPFAMDVYNVTNACFLNFVEAGGYEERRYWTPESWAWKEQTQKSHPAFWKKTDREWRLRDFFEEIALPLDWPVYVTQAEAAAYARFAGKQLPTEAEWHRAAYGDAQVNQYPWGNSAPSPDKGNFNFYRYSPVSVGCYPSGASVFGVQEMLGNGWEWTCTQFGPFEGFRASTGYPQYSTDFFDARHYVVKGASCFTDTRLMRRSFRNWYFGHYPYAYATFRCVVRR